MNVSVRNVKVFYSCDISVLIQCFVQIFLYRFILYRLFCSDTVSCRFFYTDTMFDTNFSVLIHFIQTSCVNTMAYTDLLIHFIQILLIDTVFHTSVLI
jgi:hypothetical protein